MSNPLVADVVDSTSSTSGLWLVESVNSTNTAIQNGDWLEAGLGVADLVLSALDPFATIISNGVGWLIEHVGPLSDALDALAGNPDEIRSHADTWSNVAGEVNSVATELGNLIQSDVTTWTGTAADAYRTRAADTANLILAAGAAAGGAAEGIQRAGEVVSAVRDAVRDIIADVVGSMVSWALQVLFTLGIGLIWVVPKVVAKVAQTAATIAQLITKLTTSLNRLKPLLGTLGDDFATAARGLKAIKPGDNHTPRALDAPTTTPSTARSTTPDTGPPITADNNPADSPRPDIDISGSSPDGATGTRGAPDISPTGTRSLPGGNTSRSLDDGAHALSPSAARSFDFPPMADRNPTTPGLGGPSTAPSSRPAGAQWNHFTDGFVRNPADPTGPPLRRRFRLDTVYSNTLRDKNGRVLGIGFPTKPEDARNQQNWANADHGHWDRKNLEIARDRPQDRPTGYWERTAPWANEPSPSRPFVAMAHSGGNQFQVQTPTGPNNQMENVTVTPESYHKIVTSNRVYQDRMAGNTNPLLMVSCNTGSPGREGASRFANALHESGDYRSVYAPNSLASHGVMPDNKAVIAVDRVNGIPAGYNRF
ncbi:MULTISPECIES: WXG100 family type VII secretion target [Actinoalloteichus]|uniref:Putative T7SS secretion signal domain-containing protein n=1 Tax=Actinoalloteichus fjordicus TaxID=1612552 RepID=A0AAC9LFG9_9PSEU|nr:MULTISPECIES: WXG100 family type VII secretion target [Actinoalloteichus]APU16968.1 hypothetical protein UA74_24770 [Actinoalloteichus fjordicus]APU23048.1 hypothetical protein UA75_25350 [Actinoalloteichus sp. GBA129-24]